ncbi:deoxyribodipyrimidine photo-lyase [Pseudooceanicola sp.]|uniref:cryptochrome/photolyase family protein n=1 Tax=Pseudooceanicola sp. TaxID=1914328 RepID=UPI0026071175|nr:deoxyribodipyrimidine photo-lyase [Pseudooceanicola sp.]MDF1854187.1 deoxyribodipyrimidine photo-lyase [Pseudooceanicola sp.]
MTDLPANRPRPILFWFRRDLRLGDNPGLLAAARAGQPVIPVFIRDAAVEMLGAAPRWRLQQGLAALSEALAARGSRLILRAGPAAEVLAELAGETGAGAVHWTRLYDPEARARDARVSTRLQDCGIAAREFGGHLLFEPDSVRTSQGGAFKVFTPFWRAVQNRALPEPGAAPDLTAPAAWPESDRLADWRLDHDMQRGAAVVARYEQAGEAAALTRIARFLAADLADYETGRDRVAETATSGMSAHLSLGEVSPLTLWHRALAARAEPGGEAFRRQLVWREFAYHLMAQDPRLLESAWRPGWDHFPWRRDARAGTVLAWQQGRTGAPFVDAAMREMYVTGHMHNRARMIVASYLTKHLLCDWRIGQRWFEHCLADWDPAANALGWQWVAGSGPDAAPFFRVFNPALQAEKFDPDGQYRRRWIAEGQAHPPATALAFFDAIPKSWGLRADADYPAPIVNLKQGRADALAAYKEFNAGL